MSDDAQASLRAARARAAAGHLAQARAAMEAAGWAVQPLLECLPVLVGQLYLLPHHEQLPWVARLRHLCFLPEVCHPGRDLAFEVGTLCASLGHWATASELFLHSLASSGEHPATHHSIGIAAWQLARHESAAHHLGLAAALDPECHGATIARQQAWLRHCRGLPDSGAAPLCLVPLGPQHADTLAYRQLHPDGLALAGLPFLADRHAARLWIDGQVALPGRASFAVIHAEYGLIGGCALQARAGKAGLHYWISEDFQGQGYGSKVLELLAGIACQQGVGTLYAVVLARNHGSLRTLRRAGYRSLPGRRNGAGESTRICFLKLPVSACPPLSEPHP